MSSQRQQVSQAKTLLYRKPKDELQRMYRWGPRAYFSIERWKREMEKAAKELPIPDDQGAKSEGQSVEIWFLTGKKFWYQTAFCAWTFAKHSGREVVLNLVDDGSLEAEHEEGLRRLFPKGVTLRKDSVKDQIESLLPTEQFPILRQRWDDYINIRKLTDVHLGSTGVKLVLDSDMLFFRRSDALLKWWDRAVAAESAEIKGQRAMVGSQESEGSISADSSIQRSDISVSVFPPCLMVDCEESYGYSRPLMEELAGTSILPLLNVGICGLSSESLDWEELEQWCQILVEREGTSYYLEQALVAMLASRETPKVMTRKDYITFPTREQTLKGSGVLQHYVADSKPWYFRHAWEIAAEAKL